MSPARSGLGPEVGRGCTTRACRHREGVVDEDVPDRLEGVAPQDPVFWRVHGSDSPVRVANVVVCPFFLCRHASRRFAAL